MMDEIEVNRGSTKRVEKIQQLRINLADKSNEGTVVVSFLLLLLSI